MISILRSTRHTIKSAFSFSLSLCVFGFHSLYNQCLETKQPIMYKTYIPKAGRLYSFYSPHILHVMYNIFVRIQYVCVCVCAHCIGINKAQTVCSVNFCLFFFHLLCVVGLACSTVRVY